MRPELHVHDVMCGAFGSGVVPSKSLCRRSRVWTNSQFHISDKLRGKYWSTLTRGRGWGVEEGETKNPGEATGPYYQGFTESEVWAECNRLWWWFMRVRTNWNISVIINGVWCSWGAKKSTRDTIRRQFGVNLVQIDTHKVKVKKLNQHACLSRVQWIS